MAQFTKNQYADIVVEGIGIMAIEDKPALVDILKRSGSLVTELSTTDEILDASFKSLKDNKNFRKEIQDYLTIALSSAEDEQNNFSNGTGQPSKVGTYLKGVFGKKEGGSGFGNALRSIFSQENISTAVGLGMTYASTRLNANAQKGSNQQAIDFERAKAETAMAEAKRLETEGLLAQMKSAVVGTDGKRKGWVLPVVIIGGVAVVGTILYFVLRKRN